MGSPVAAALAVWLAFVAVPRPAASEAAPPSWVQFELDVPLASVQAEFDRRMPLGGGPPFQVRLANGLTLEISARREPLVLSTRGDTLVVQSRLRHTLHIAGGGQPRTGCGTAAEALSADIACSTRFGWNETWGIESVTSTAGIVFGRRCKPQPPGINLTKRAVPVLQTAFVDTMPGAAAGVAAAFETREFIAAVWDALAGGVVLAEGWLDFAPEAVFVDPVRFSRAALQIRGAVRVRPQVRPGRPSPPPGPFPSAEATRVRLSGGDFGVLVRIDADLMPAQERLRAVVDSLCGVAPAIPLRAITLRGSEQSVELELDLGGDVEGRYALIAGLEYEDAPPAVVLAAPAWTADAERAIARLPEARRRRFNALANAVAALRIDMDAAVARIAPNLGANLNRRIGDGLRLEGALHSRQGRAVHCDGNRVTLDLMLGGRAVIRPFQSAP